jgi:hypothetical protein
MSGLPKQFEFMSSTAAEGLGLVVASSAQNATSLRQAENEPSTLVKFPKRPDFNVLNETIPLFHIAQNNHGFWVAREADGHCGGVFLLRRSAVRFAQRNSAPTGCAIMFLDAPLELDVTNEGSSITESLVEIIDFARRRAPTFTAFIAMALAKCRQLDTQILCFCRSEPKDRAAPELIRDGYGASSKNGDDTTP